MTASTRHSGAASPATEPQLFTVVCEGGVRLPLPHATFRRLSLHPSTCASIVSADTPSDARPLRLVVTALLHEGIGARLYRAREAPDESRMEICGADIDRPTREFVLKTDFLFAEGRERALAREAAHYAAAAPLQGLVIPSCFGLFEAHIQGSGGPFARRIRCLLLEYCGAPLRTRRLSQLPRQMKARIIDKVFYFHDVTGMAHGNLWDGHLLARGGLRAARKSIHAPSSTYADLHPRVEPTADSEPFFVDLSECTPHACHCSMEVVEDDPQPSPADFKCKEIWELVSALGVWSDEER